MKKIFVLTIALVLSLGLLTACGDDRVDQLRADHGVLVDLFNEVLEIYEEVRPYHDVENMVVSINLLSDAINDLEGHIKSGMSDGDIEAISSGIRDAIASVNQIRSSLLSLR
ncbi:MAG: hypothetical protein FWH17_00825 [Oscillospiraceae bacterium]|nr:hypothetical protein [Oscillospiraceae bacterium]